MKKTTLLKTMLLLCALIVGSGSAWAANKVLTFDVSSNPGGWPTSNSTTLTNYTYTLSSVDYTFALSNVKCNSGYLMITATGVLGLPAIADYKLTKVVASNSSGCSTSTNVGISSSSSSASYVSGGSTKTWSTQSSSYTYTLTGTSANTMYYLYVTNKNAQVISLELTYEPVAPAYTITAQSNNNTYGTVSLSGTVITGSPKSGCRYASPAYSVSPANSATVVQDGNSFTVTPSANTTVTINFEAIPTHTATFYVNGESSSDSFAEGAAITFPSDPSDIHGKTFMGWKKGSAIDGVTNEEPTLLTSDDMGNADVSYYAVFAKVISNTPASWTETALNAMTASDILVISNGTYAMNNDNGLSAPVVNSITVSEGKITSAVADKLKWNVTGNATDGYIFYPNGSTTTWLYCSTNADSGTNNNIKVGTGDRKVWELDGDGYLVTKDSKVDRYLSIYNSQDFRGYVNTDLAFEVKFYKYIPASKVVEGYCTTVHAEPSDPVVAGSTVTLATTANMDGWRSYNNNSSKKYTVSANTKVYYASATGDNKVTLEEIAGGVPANTAVILHKTDAAGAAAEIVLTETDESITAPVSNELLVSTAGQNLGKVYRLGYKSSDGVGFYTYTSASAPAGVIYVSSVSSANFLGLDFGEGDVTAINKVEVAKQNAGEYYNLAGQRVAQPTKGLYIVNGKKVIVK